MFDMSVLIVTAGPESSSPGPFDWTVEHLMENLKSSAGNDEGDQGMT